MTERLTSHEACDICGLQYNQLAHALAAGNLPFAPSAKRLHARLWSVDEVAWLYLWRRLWQAGLNPRSATGIIENAIVSVQRGGAAGSHLHGSDGIFGTLTLDLATARRLVAESIPNVRRAA